MNNAANSQKKRSLILAGGGVKVAFQAGVLQVLLDEANLTFDHADGVSGGTFNLAMYCQGMTGTQIADNWRKLPIALFDDFNWEQYVKLYYAESVLTFDRFRKHIFPTWGLDWDKIRASEREATFNIYNFSRHELEIVTPDRMTEDHLIACSTLPMWFPPVTIGESLYIDAVFMTDANIEEAIRRGADELWVIWTVSERSEWNAGFIANYFQIIETSANGHFRSITRRIEASNAAQAEGKIGEFGRHIELKVLKAEVPLHYLINLSSDRVVEAVNRGVEYGRAWCKELGIPLVSASEPPLIDPTSLTFTEEMKGFVTFDEKDYDRGFRQESRNRKFLVVHLTIDINGVHHFVTEPRHNAPIEGYIDCEALGGDLPVEKGTFNLFVDEGDPTRKKMLYRLYFYDSAGHPLTLSGFKMIRDDKHFDILSDTTTLFTRILQGHVEAEDEEHAEVVASGIISIHFLDFLKQLTTMHAEGPNPVERVSTLVEFGQFFLGELWDVYAQRVLSYGPY